VIYMHGSANILQCLCPSFPIPFTLGMNCAVVLHNGNEGFKCMEAGEVCGSHY
jgi:hypothetical protein